jgi:hypothetical protein
MLPTEHDGEPSPKKLRQTSDEVVIHKEMCNDTNLLFECVLHRGHLFAMLIEAAYRFWTSIIVSFESSFVRIFGADQTFVVENAFEFHILRQAFVSYRFSRTDADDPCQVRFCVRQLHCLLKYSAMTASDCLRLWITNDGTHLGVATDGMHAVIACTITKENSISTENDAYHDPLRVDSAEFRRILRQVNVGCSQSVMSIHRYEDDMFLQLKSQLARVTTEKEEKDADAQGYVVAHSVITNLHHEDACESLLRAHCLLNIEPLRVALETVWEQCDMQIFFTPGQPLHMTFHWFEYAELTLSGPVISVSSNEPKT